ncbi:MAG: histidine kinase [Ferruginibacter sp.]|nr:histidine kinase [Ferruginibacter sp.]
MRNYSNNKKLFYLAAVISLIILMIFGLLYLEKSRDQVQYIDAVERTYKVLSTISSCEKALIESEAAQRGYLLTADNSFKEVFESILPTVDSTVKEIGRLTLDNSSQKTFFLQLTKFVAAKEAIMKENLTLKPDNPVYVDSLRKGAFVMDNCRYYMKKMRDVEEGLLKVRLEKKNKYQRLNRSFFRATFITACLICIIAILVFFRELSIRLLTQQNLRAKIKELSESKSELEEITFAASHDLQEPIRKIRILSSLMIKRLDKVPEADLEVLHRIHMITEEMHVQMNDLVLYTNLLDPKEKHTDVNLYEVLKFAYNTVLANEDVHFRISTQLPVIKGSVTQLQSMFIQLLDNSCKFKSPDRELSIEVTYELTGTNSLKGFSGQVSQQYHKVTITDNGIGFDNDYNEKIFGLFQRLHGKTEYPGKGIGLSIARRVMANHKGTISAFSENRQGANFILLFPAIF